MFNLCCAHENLRAIINIIKSMKPTEEPIDSSLPQKRTKPLPPLDTNKSGNIEDKKDDDYSEGEGSESKHKIKLIKNRESASRSRKKKKAIFESLKNELNAASTKRNSTKLKVDQYAEMLEKAYQDNETLRTRVDFIVNENSKLKDEIMQLQQSLGQMQSAMYTLMLQKKSGLPMMPNTFTNQQPT